MYNSRIRPRTEATITFDEQGNFKISHLIEAQNILDVLDDLNYDKEQLKSKLKLPNEKLRQKLTLYLDENSYLKTVLAT